MIRQSAGKEIYLAYLVGVYLGDGCLTNQRGVMTFRLNTIDNDFAEKVRNTLGNLIGRNGSLCVHSVKKSSKPNHSLSCPANELSWLKESTSSKEKIPSFIFGYSRKEQIEFISGILDSEGYVSISKHRPGCITIGLKATSDWMLELYKMFQRLGVKIGKVGNEILPSGKIAHRFNFNSRSFIENGLYFNIKRKQDRLNEYRFNPQRSYAGQWMTIDDMIRTRQRCREVGRNVQPA